MSASNTPRRPPTSDSSSRIDEKRAELEPSERSRSDEISHFVKQLVTDDRGQAYTLEAVAGGIMMLSAVIFAIQATAITPLTVSTANQHIESQLRIQADGVLSAADKQGSLTDQLLYYDTTAKTFYNATPSGYVGTVPDTEFGGLLNETFYEDRAATNVYVSYMERTGKSDTEILVYQGSPSSNAVSAEYTVVLYDQMRLTAPGESQTLKQTDNYFAPDAAPDSPVYNVVQVRIVVWRM